MPTPNRLARRAALAYVLLAEAWILLTDQLAARWGYASSLAVHGYKGTAFVLVTGLLFFALVRRLQRQLAQLGEDSQHADEALRASEAQYRRLVEQAPYAIYRFRLLPNPGFEYVSPAATALTGYTPGEHYADPELPLKIVHPEDRPLLQALWSQKLITADPVVLRWRHKEGRIVWTEQRNVLVRDGEGRVVAVEGIARDITAQHQQERRRQVLQQVRGAVWAMQEAGEIGQVLGAVEAALRDLEVPFRECGINLVDLGRPDPVVAHHAAGTRMGPEGPEARGVGARIIARIWQEGQVAYRPDLEAEDRYGEREHLALRYGSPRRAVLDVPFSHGTLAVNSDKAHAFTPEHLSLVEELAGVLSEGFRRQEDLRRLHETQQQLYQSQKLEALGRLAGGVAHDFNNLLTVIDGYSLLALKQLPPEQGLARSAIEEVRQAGERAEALVRQLLAFSRRQEGQRQVLDLNRLVAGVEKMLGRLIGEDVELEVKPAPDAGTVEVDPGQFEQVLMNLAVNARDAMPQGGALRLETGACAVDEELARALGLEAGGRYCRLSLCDTGVGMSEEVQQHIFEPFFTTKAPGQGTGLGLATVYGIVKSHRGGIRVHSRQGEGATFEIFLPAAGAAASEGAPQAPGPAPRGAETILLVEDDPMVRRVVRQLLGDLGYRVLEAGGAEAALEQCRRHPGAIALLLTDVVLPGMNGFEVAGRVAALHPEAKVLYMSGYSERVGPPPKGTPFLPKPFTPEQLARRVRQAMDHGPQP
jgi:PAS domain S-box-containing protein